MNRVLLLAAVLVTAIPARAQLDFSTFLGGTGNDYVHHVLSDALGNVYVTGRTAATDFPTTPGAYSRTYAGGDHDVFIAKINPTGTALVWSTLLGGTGDDQPAQIALDSSGNVLVIGTTSSTDLPVTGDAPQPSNAGGYDVFLARISADGSTLQFCTYFGGSGKDTPAGLALKPSSIYVAGTTSSSDLPVTPGAFQPVYGGGTTDYGDMFAASLSADGQTLNWCTYLGGAHDDECRALGLTSDGELTVAGWTARVPDVVGPDFPTTEGAYDRTYHGDRDVAVARLASDGSALLFGTFMGGPGKDQANSLAVLSDGSVLVAGDTASPTFPTTAGVLQTAFGGVRDVFVSKLSASGGSLAWSTFLGGSQEEGYGTVTTDPSGNVIVGGYTLSSDFPVTPGCYQPARAGQSDVFLCRVTPDAAVLGYSTFFGGSLTDRGGAGVDLYGNVLLVGFTGSSNFPITPGAFQTSIGVGWCGVVAKFNPAPVATRLYVLDRSGTIGYLVYLRGYLMQLNKTLIAGRMLSFSVEGSNVGTQVTDASGRATLPYVIPESGGAGPRPIDVEFAGDATFLGSVGHATLSVSRGTITIWVLSRTVAKGSSAYLRAYARRLPDKAWSQGRLITISLDGTPLGSATTNASGMAAVLYKVPLDMALGAHAIGAEFAGDAWYTPASGAGVLNVTP